MSVPRCYDRGVDYEFRIKLLEKETAHLKEMQTLLGQGEDVADDRLDKTQAILATVGTRLQEIAEAHNNLTIDLDRLDKKFEALVDLLLHQPRNGHEKQQ